MAIVTTSWDDGDPNDITLAELLRSNGVAGTFYIPIIGYDGRRIMDPPGLRDLMHQGFGIGAHGTSHHALAQFHSKDLAREVRVCKERLEDTLGRAVKLFAYPKGRYSASVVGYLQRAGYLGARTTKMLARRLNFCPFKIPTTLHAYPHPTSDYLRNLARGLDLKVALEYVTRFSNLKNWVELGKRTFDLVAEQGGVWHLFGHSWEIQELGLWDDLKDLLGYVSNRDGVLYLSNEELLDFLPRDRPNGFGTQNLL